MKIEKTKSVIFRPLLLGLIGLVVGGGLFIYYYFFKEDTSVAAYVINGAIALAGVIGMISTIYVGIVQYLKIKTKKTGSECIAKYVSNSTNVTQSKINYYKITYTYTLNNQEFIKTSSSEFIFKEVLILKCVHEFKIRVLNGRVVLDDDLDQLFEDNKEAILELEKKYNIARGEVDKILNK